MTAHHRSLGCKADREELPRIGQFDEWRDDLTLRGRGAATVLDRSGAALLSRRIGGHVEALVALPDLPVRRKKNGTSVDSLTAACIRISHLTHCFLVF